MTQLEIARQLDLAQSLISKDLTEIRNRVKKQARDKVSDDLWEYGRNLPGTDAAVKKLREIVEDKSVSAKGGIQALALIMSFYDARSRETLIASMAFKAAGSGKADGIYGR
jgi:hypothetical protein